MNRCANLDLTIGAQRFAGRAGTEYGRSPDVYDVLQWFSKAGGGSAGTDQTMHCACRLKIKPPRAGDFERTRKRCRPIPIDRSSGVASRIATSRSIPPAA